MSGADGAGPDCAGTGWIEPDVTAAPQTNLT
jgi:hypothetical protein